MTIYIVLSVLTFVGMGIGVAFSYIAYKGMKSFDMKNKEDSKEILKALRQAEDYSDKMGWISVKFIDRDNYFDKGVK